MTFVTPNSRLCSLPGTPVHPYTPGGKDLQWREDAKRNIRPTSSCHARDTTYYARTYVPAIQPGWVGGSGSLIAGVTMFLGVGLLPEWLFIVFAIVVSLWMVAIGILMWRRAAQNGGPTFDEANSRVGPSS